MKYIVKTPYLDLQLEKRVEVDEIVEFDETRTNELRDKGIVLEEVKEAKEKITKVQKSSK